MTADLPGIGGRIRERPEDFLVDEQPLYQPSGEGEHIYLLIEKRGLSTMQAVREVAKHFGVHPTAVGYAGLKDKHAITRQVLSVHVPGKKPEDFPMMGGGQHERIGVLWADLHTNKLRRGHLLGNRFSIKIRGVPPTAALTANKALLLLEKVGVPNRFGEQRFGYRGNNQDVGRAMVLGDPEAAVRALLAAIEGIEDRQMEGRRLYMDGKYEEALRAFPYESRAERAVLGALSRGTTPGKAIGGMGRQEQDFYLAAWQSSVFNRVLDERMRAGELGVLRAGDLAIKHANEEGRVSRAVFAVGESDLGAELDERLRKFEISPSGPMWGAEMMRPPPESPAYARELQALEAPAQEGGGGVTLAQLEEFGRRRPGRMVGERRALRIPLTYPDVEGGVDEHGSYVRVAFDLPRGAFATTVLRELMKPSEGIADEDGEGES
jgi:tRNA pseudouridine13 synthase